MPSEPTRDADYVVGYCARCAGSGEYPPGSGAECSTCHGEGEYRVPATEETDR